MERGRIMEKNEIPTGHRPITTRMTLVKKHDGNGQVTRYTVRLVAHGFKQRPGINYDETYAPLISVPTIRMVLSYAVAKDVEIEQLASSGPSWRVGWRSQ
jgi:hypothetical protein